MTDKQKALDKIAKEIVACKICKQKSLGLPVIGEGNSNAKIVFVGEAPGKKEAESGRPFVGRSGKFLRENIRRVGLDDTKDVYITSPVKYLPKRGTPDKVQIAHGMIHLQKQLDIIKPKLIVLLGSTAALGVLGEFVPVAQKHGQIIKKMGLTYFISFHPAAAIRFAKFRPIFAKDFKKLKNLIY
ncbi:MAG: uracil-DNA glycosylase [Candidatus Doudnabacteria bacterium]|nr:uracil-DNA glycosylase [Candidatus Doudnabacteria bacterium]